MATNYVDVKKFNKVMLVYNSNSGKQLFASMMSKVNELYKRLKMMRLRKRLHASRWTG